MSMTGHDVHDIITIDDYINGGIGSKVRALESARSFERFLVVHSTERMLCGRRILKHRSTCGSGCPKLATHSATYSATDSDFLQTSFQSQVRTLNTKITISIFQAILKMKFNVKGSGNRIIPKLRQHAYENGFKRQPASLGSLHKHVTFDLTFEL